MARSSSLASDPAVPEPRACVLLRWLEGRFVDERLTPRHLRGVARLQAGLQAHAEALVTADGFVRPRGRHADAPGRPPASPPPPPCPSGRPPTRPTPTAPWSSWPSSPRRAGPRRRRRGRARPRPDHHARAGRAARRRAPDPRRPAPGELPVRRRRGAGDRLRRRGLGLPALRPRRHRVRARGAARAPTSCATRCSTSTSACARCPTRVETHLDALTVLRRIQLLMWGLESREHPAFRDAWTGVGRRGPHGGSMLG